jgi:hypothetical protein
VCTTFSFASVHDKAFTSLSAGRRLRPKGRWRVSTGLAGE